MAPTSLPGTTDRRLASLLTLFANNATIAISGARYWHLRDAITAAEDFSRASSLTDHDGGAVGACCHSSADRSAARCEMAKRLSVERQEAWRHPNGNARRANCGAFRNRRYRHQRESGTISR